MKDCLLNVSSQGVEFYADGAKIIEKSFSDYPERTFGETERSLAYLGCFPSFLERVDESEKRQIRRTMENYGKALFGFLGGKNLAEELFQAGGVSIHFQEEAMRTLRWNLLNDGEVFFSLTGGVQRLQSIGGVSYDRAREPREELRFGVFSSDPEWGDESSEPFPSYGFGIPESVPFFSPRSLFNLRWDIDSRLSPKKILEEAPRFSPHAAYLSGYFHRNCLIVEDSTTGKLQAVPADRLQAAFKKMAADGWAFAIANVKALPSSNPGGMEDEELQNYGEKNLKAGIDFERLLLSSGIPYVCSFEGRMDAIRIKMFLQRLFFGLSMGLGFRQAFKSSLNYLEQTSPLSWDWQLVRLSVLNRASLNLGFVPLAEARPGSRPPPPRPEADPSVAGSFLPAPDFRFVSSVLREMEATFSTQRALLLRSDAWEDWTAYVERLLASAISKEKLAVFELDPPLSLIEFPPTPEGNPFGPFFAGIATPILTGRFLSRMVRPRSETATEEGKAKRVLLIRCDLCRLDDPEYRLKNFLRSYDRVIAFASGDVPGFDVLEWDYGAFRKSLLFRNFEFPDFARLRFGENRFRGFFLASLALERERFFALLDPSFESEATGETLFSLLSECMGKNEYSAVVLLIMLGNKVDRGFASSVFESLGISDELLKRNRNPLVRHSADGSLVWANVVLVEAFRSLPVERQRTIGGELCNEAFKVLFEQNPSDFPRSFLPSMFGILDVLTRIDARQACLKLVQFGRKFLFRFADREWVSRFVLMRTMQAAVALEDRENVTRILESLLECLFVVPFKWQLRLFAKRFQRARIRRGVENF